jgi:hypothetical protein
MFIDFWPRFCQGTEASPPNLPPQREADRSVSGRQSSHPKTFLQLPHRVAERRGRDIETRCRGSKAPLIGNGDERVQISQVTAFHS